MKAVEAAGMGDKISAFFMEDLPDGLVRQLGMPAASSALPLLFSPSHNMPWDLQKAAMLIRKKNASSPTVTRMV
ncbi:hypothetical protein [Paracoccus thiocyanatus]|uniref:hypothetical protein n=1 Tax=Paracoccus thiocyanatus TaxID=34006 RepID=UPI0011C02B85